MPKAMLFVDGTWLYRNVPHLGEKYGKGEFHVDYAKLPRVLAEEAAAKLGADKLDVVRRYWFGSHPQNYNAADEPLVERVMDFFAVLREDFGYDVAAYPIDYVGRRVRGQDRDPLDSFTPAEKCVDVAMASQMVYSASIPGTYDIAIALAGDRDYLPAFRLTRQLGKRVVLASIRESCSSAYQQPLAEPAIDGLPVYLDDLLDKIEYRVEPQQLKCQSPDHRGDPHVWTTFRPRTGQAFYCDECRKRHAEQKAQALAQIEQTADQLDLPDGRTLGLVKNLRQDKGFGFLQSPEGRDYFFHATDLEDGIVLEELSVGEKLTFEITQEPSAEQGGRAVRVRRPSTPASGD